MILNACIHMSAIDHAMGSVNVWNGASGGLRSRDLPLTRRVLLADSSIYQLSYRGLKCRDSLGPVLDLRYASTLLVRPDSTYDVTLVKTWASREHVRSPHQILASCWRAEMAARVLGCSATKSITSTTVTSMSAPDKLNGAACDRP